MMTLKQARKDLWKVVRGAGDPYDPLVLETLNKVLQTFHMNGKWKGSYVEVVLTEYDGVTTLPRQCQSLLFYRQNSWPTAIKNQWFEWQNWGVGYREADGCNLIEAFDKGPGFCTFRDFSEPRQLRIKTFETEDATISATFQGTDDDDKRVYTTDPDAIHPINGETVTCVAGTADTTFTFKTFTGFVKPVTRGYVEVWTINPDDDSDETLIGQYEPGEEVPDYRRYKVGNATQTNPTNTIYGLCKLAYTPLASEMDFVIPSNPIALEYGILARQYDMSADGEKNASYYWGKAFQSLNAELSQERGGAKSPPVFDFGAMGQRKVLNIY